MRLLLLGCTGFVGRELVPQLLNNGHQLTLVSRKTNRELARSLQTEKLTVLQLDPTNPQNWEKGPLLDSLTKAEGVVNLAGEPIAEKRWTISHCKILENSRLQTTGGLVNAMQRLRKPPRVLVNASAIGYYGTSSDADFSEQSKYGQDFLANLCKQWETLAFDKPKGTRLVIIRMGIVFGPDGGALGKMLPIFKSGLGGKIGSGKQWMSWIHRTDLCQIIEQSIVNRSWSGVINGVAPDPVIMADFAGSLGRSLGRPSLVPVPGPILKLLLGDGARVVLEGQKVFSNRLNKLGFKFKFSNLENALESIVHSA